MLLLRITQYLDREIQFTFFFILGLGMFQAITEIASGENFQKEIPRPHIPFPFIGMRPDICKAKGGVYNNE